MSKKTKTKAKPAEPVLTVAPEVEPVPVAEEPAPAPVVEAVVEVVVEEAPAAPLDTFRGFFRNRK